MKNAEFIVNGKTLNVRIGDLEKVKSMVSSYLTDFDDGCDYFEIYEERETSRDEVETDVKGMLAFLDELEKDPSILQKFVEEVRKKKNGLFWRNSGSTVKRMDNCTDFFTDFTNAWSVPEIRLDVSDENTCNLTFRSRTYTY